MSAGEGRGLAFIEFVNNRDAEDAKYGMDRQIMDGKEVGSLARRQLVHGPHIVEHRAHISTRCQECPEASCRRHCCPHAADCL